MSNGSTLPRWCERISLFTKPTASAKANTIWFGIVQMVKLNKLDVFSYNPLKGNKYETQDLLSLGGFLFAKLFDTRSVIFSKLLSGFGSFDQGFR